MTADSTYDLRPVGVRRSRNVVDAMFRMRSTYFIIAAAGTYAHLFLALDLFGVVARLSACALLYVVLYITYRLVKTQGESPLQVLILWQCYVMYAFAQFTQHAMWLQGSSYVPAYDAITKAAVLATLASIALVVGFRLGHRLSFVTGLSIDHLYPQPRREWSRLLVFFAVATLVEWSVVIFSPGRLPVEIRNIMLMVFSPHLSFVLNLYRAHRWPDLFWRRFVIAHLAALVFLGFLSGQIENVIVPMYLFFAAQWVWRRSLKLHWIAGAIAIFIVLSPVKHYYRAFVYAEDSNVSAVDRVKLWGDSFAAAWEDPLLANTAVERAADRASSILPFAQVIEWVPSLIPYEHGRGLGTTILYFVPRFIWPNKPGISDLINNKYALQFHLSSVEGLQTATIGIVQPLDGYWDFGVIGALLYPMIFGSVLGFAFARAKTQPIEMILSLVFSGSFFQALSSLQNILASLFTMFVGCWISIRILDALTARRGSVSRDLGPSERQGVGAQAR